MLVFGFAAITKIADIGLRYDHIATARVWLLLENPNMRGRYWLVALALLSGFAGLGSPASAVLVDWSTLNWPSGSLNNSYDVDPGSPGNDVTVAITGNTGQLQPSLDSNAGNPQTPAITRAFDGGLNTSPKTLELAITLANNTQAITVTINFSNSYVAGASNVSFKLFDIDLSNGGAFGTFQDQIRSISATSTTGTPIAPTITGLGANVTPTGTGLAQILTGNATSNDLGSGSGDGNATISFNTTGIRSITFTYGAGSLFTNPTYEHIGIYNLDYSVVPETNPTWFSLVSCGLLVCWNIRQALTASRAKRGRGFLKRGVLRGTPRFGSATSG